MTKPNHLKVAVIFGGTNTEHEVSLVSARSIIDNLDKSKYLVTPIKITKQNRWVNQTGKSIDVFKVLRSTDVVFPVIHGPSGEDGTLQGMLEMLDRPYVGCGVLDSAVCMDKVIQKQICRFHHIPTVDFYWFTDSDWKTASTDIISDIVKRLGFPCFVKPANQGSSIGVSKAKNKTGLKTAINHALKLDHKIIVEKAVKNPREIECSVLGNDQPAASTLGEIVPSNEFYDYDAKYIDGQSQAIIPTKLPAKLTKAIQQTALDAFSLLNCHGLARVDFLVEGKTDQYYLNELNTMPGFTSISMYPKLWQASGLSYPRLLDKLIDLALARYKSKKSLNPSYRPKSAWYK